MNVSFICFCRAVENIVLSVCITKAAISFNKWHILWFLLLVLLNQPRLTFEEYDDEDEDEE